MYPTQWPCDTPVQGLSYCNRIGEGKGETVQHALPFGGPQVALQRNVSQTGCVTCGCGNLNCVRNIGLEVDKH